MTKIGIVLSGCGVFDGSEIHEAVATMLALSRAGVQYKCMAPDAPQLHVVNHFSGAVTEGETRNVLVEAARIARGDILGLRSVNPADYDGFVFPGGFGAAKNLCDFAVNGSDCYVSPEVERMILQAHKLDRPMAFVCIAPAILARIFGKDGVRLTIGDDAEAASAITAMGATHVTCEAGQLVIDESLGVISSPAYMKAENIAELFDDVTASVNALLELVRQRQSAGGA